MELISNNDYGLSFMKSGEALVAKIIDIDRQHRAVARGAPEDHGRGGASPAMWSVDGLGGVGNGVSAVLNGRRGLAAAILAAARTSGGCSDSGEGQGRPGGGGGGE